MSETAPETAQVRAALEELLGWQGISRSPQISELLRYVVDKTLAGEGASIKAYSIAVDVLGRPADFDPQSDPIVRVQARRLRALLDQYYNSGLNRSGVEIRLPLGRYVPEFVTAVPQSASAPFAGGPSATVLEPSGDDLPSRRLPKFAANALLGFGFTIVGVALAVGVVRWMSPPPAQIAVPTIPQVMVMPFDNLTGDPVLDDDVRRVGTNLAAALSKFDSISVSENGAPLSIRGTVQEAGGQFSVKVLIGQGNGILWSSTALAPLGFTDTEALARATTSMAAQIANASGPLHAAGRSWLKLQGTLPVAPTLYLCQLEYMQWRDTRILVDADRTLDCFAGLLAAKADDAAARAAWAGVQSWRASFLAKPGSDLVDVLTEPTTQVARAVVLSPSDSFVHEQQALVLGRQGSIDAAIGAIEKAMELNPANIDAVAVAAIVYWLSGDFSRGTQLGETAIRGLATPPPWYYMPRAFEALREKRYFDAVDAALALSAGDEEFGPVIALAAAQRAGRTDLVDRLRPIIMGNPRFQEGGILPRLALLIRPQVLLDRIRDGLTIAGIPPNALIKPFNPDGTERR